MCIRDSNSTVREVVDMEHPSEQRSMATDQAVHGCPFEAGWSSVDTTSVTRLLGKKKHFKVHQMFVSARALRHLSNAKV